MRILLALLIWGILCNSSALAAPKPPSKESQEKAAKKACATSDYRKGIDILADLYVESNNPTYVYNQGRCYEQNSRWEQAVERFREYVRKRPDITAEDRANVDKHIADCEGFLPKPQHVATPVVSTTPVAPAPATQPIPPPTPELVESTTIVAAPPPSNRGGALRVAGLVTAGLGIAAVAGGAVFNVKHESLVTQQNTRFSRARESDVETYQTLAWVGYGVGAAAILTGGTLWLLGQRSGRADEQSVAVLPMFNPQGAGCVLQGAF